MKRAIFTVTLIISVFFGTFTERAYGQNAGTTPIDLILVLDTSTVMSSSYENVNNYLTGDFLTEFLRVGDTFHLITFADSPRFDSARRINGIGDVETIIGRMLIQYPVETGNNVASALSYVEQYINTLPNRSKKVVLVTHGAQAANSLVTGARQRMASANCTIDYVQVTPGQRLTNLPNSGRSPVAASTASAQPAAAQAPSPAPSAAASTAAVSAASPATAAAAQPAAAASTPRASTPAASSPVSSTPASTPSASTPATSSSVSSTSASTTPASTQATSSPVSSTPASTPSASTQATSSPVSSTPASTAATSSSASTQASTPSVSPTASVSASAATASAQTALSGTSTSDTAPSASTIASPSAQSAASLPAAEPVSGITSSGTGAKSAIDSTEAATVSDTAGIAAAGAAQTSASETESTSPRAASQTPAPTRTTDKSKQSNSSFTSSLPFIIGIIILILLILGLIIFLLSRKLSSSPNRVISTTNSRPKQEPAARGKDLANFAAGQTRQRTTPYDNRQTKADSGKPVVINPDGPLLLNLFVNDQNTSIGKRNIHSLKSGYSLTVGGGKSDDYFIFLVPVPAKLGEIRRNGSQLTFIPHKPKYFPDIGSNEVKDCINKSIRIISDKNYEMRFRFEMYEDPLIELNRLLHSVKVPG